MPKLFGFNFKLLKKSKSASSEIQMESVEMKGGEKVKVKQQITWREMIRTTFLVLAFMVWGMSVTVQFATFEDLRIRLNTTPHGLSYAMSIGMMGQMMGGLFAAIPDRFARTSDLQISSMLFMAAMAYVYIPFCRSLTALGICYMLTNLGFYCMQAAAHSQISSLWARGCKSARYALHFGFSIGATIGPFIAAPFVSGVRGYDPVESPNGHVQVANVTNNTHVINATTPEPQFYILRSPSRDESTIEYAYIMVFAFTLIISALLVLCFFVALMSGTLNRLDKRGQKKDCIGVWSPARWAGGNMGVGVLMALFLTLWCLLQRFLSLGTVTYLTQFAVDTGFSQREAYILTAVVYSTGILSRGLGIAAAKFVSIRLIILIVVAGQTLCGLLCGILGTKFSLALWIIAPILGFFREAAMPTVYAWVGHYIVIYGVLIGFTEVLCTLAVILYTPLQGHLYEATGIESIFATTVIFGLLQLVLTCFMNWYGARAKSRNTRQQMGLRADQSLKEATVETYVGVNETKPLSQSEI